MDTRLRILLAVKYLMITLFFYMKCSNKVEKQVAVSYKSSKVSFDDKTVKKKSNAIWRTKVLFEEKYQDTLFSNNEIFETIEAADKKYVYK